MPSLLPTCLQEFRSGVWPVFDIPTQREFSKVIVKLRVPFSPLPLPLRGFFFCAASLVLMLSALGLHTHLCGFTSPVLLVIFVVPCASLFLTVCVCVGGCASILFSHLDLYAFTSCPSFLLLTFCSCILS